MRCFYHQDGEAVGTCKSCGKGVCVECAVDLGKGLACRGRCEGSAQAVILLIDHNVELFTSPAKARLVVPPEGPRTGPPTEYLAAQLTSHIRETRQLQWMLGAFSSVVGVILVVTGLSAKLDGLDVVGACCIAFGVVCFLQTQRNAARPKLSATQTR